MGPDVELKGNPEVQVSKEIVPAPPLPEQNDFQSGINGKCNSFGMEALPAKQTPLSNGNEDVEVNIIGCTNSGKPLVLDVASEDVIECSSSFGDTGSGTENGSALSDAEIQSLTYAANASSPMFHDCFEPFRTRKKVKTACVPQHSIEPNPLRSSLIQRKKKLTNHWRKFIHPLMWRCKWLELKLKQLQSQALKYEKELAAYDHRKQRKFANFRLDGCDTKSVPFFGSIGRNKVMKRKKRKRVEGKCDLAKHMSNHSLFSYYENKNSADVAHLKDALGVAIGNAVNTEEFRLNDIWSFLDSKDSDKSLEDIILKIEAVHSQVHKLKTRIDVVISENPAKFNSVNKLSMHEPYDGLNNFDSNPASPARNESTFPVRSVKSEFNMGDLVMPGNEVSSCIEMFPLIEISDKRQHEVLWEDSKDGVLIHNQVAKEELHTFENVRNQLMKTTDESVEEQKSISPVQVSEPDLATENVTSNLQSAMQACSTLDADIPRNTRRGKRKTG